VTTPLPTIPWVEPATVPEATRLQKEAMGRVVVEGDIDPDKVRWIAGVDASITRDKTRMIGAICLLSWPQLTVEDVVLETEKVAFPYVPGYLSFREVPVLLKAAAKLPVQPDLVIVDGQGIAHPRRLGLASHLGLVTGWRTIGCAKSRLVGDCGELAQEKGSAVPCSDRGEMVVHLVRTRTGVKPVWVSPGHGVGHEAAVRWVLATTTRYRLPEPTRAAHREAGRYRRNLDA